jgi:hypothetical protein
VPRSEGWFAQRRIAVRRLRPGRNLPVHRDKSERLCALWASPLVWAGSSDPLVCRGLGHRRMPMLVTLGSLYAAIYTYAQIRLFTITKSITYCHQWFDSKSSSAGSAGSIPARHQKPFRTYPPPPGKGPLASRYLFRKGRRALRSWPVRALIADRAFPGISHLKGV